MIWHDEKSFGLNPWPTGISMCVCIYWAIAKNSDSWLLYLSQLHGLGVGSKPPGWVLAVAWKWVRMRIASPCASDVAGIGAPLVTPLERVMSSCTAKVCEQSHALSVVAFDYWYCSK